jgi:hypothetical protein
MPNSALKNAIKEAYALAPTNVCILETLEFYNAGGGGHIYLVKDRISHNMKIEGGVTKTFEAAPFRLALPKVSDGGLQELSISIDNIDRSISDYLKLTKSLQTVTTIKYRPYLSTDLDNPQMDPPLTLYVVSSSINTFEAKILASFLNFQNKKFPSASQYYSRSRFPSLGQ